MMFIIENNGVRVEGRYNTPAKAKREALRFFRRSNPNSRDNYVETGWQQMRDGSHSLWYDDGSFSFHTGILVKEDS